jgi:hypothetical protein
VSASRVITSPPRRGLEEDGQDDPGPYPARRSRGHARRRQADLHRSGPGGDQERVRRIVRLVSSLASSPRAKRASPGLSLPLGPLACLGGDPRAGPERARSSSCQVNSSKATGAKPLLGDTPSALAVGWPHGPVGGLERGKRRGPVPEAAPSAPRRRCRGPRGGGRRWRTVKVCRPRPRRLRLVWRMAGPRPRLVGLAAEPRGVRDRAPVASRPMCRGRDLVGFHRNPARVSFAFFRTAPTTLCADLPPCSRAARKTDLRRPVHLQRPQLEAADASWAWLTDSLSSPAGGSPGRRHASRGSTGWADLPEAPIDHSS